MGYPLEDEEDELTTLDIPASPAALLREAIILAACEAGGGGRNGLFNYLTLQARGNPKAFLGLLGKLLPRAVEMSASEEQGAAFQINIISAEATASIPMAPARWED